MVAVGIEWWEDVNVKREETRWTVRGNGKGLYDGRWSIEVID